MKRLIYFDWLRVLATIAVVTIHVSSGLVAANLFDNPKSYWIAGDFYETLSRCSVPIFVMISGALLLNDRREITYLDFFKKRASKVFIPLVAWSIVYYAYGVYVGSYPLSPVTALVDFLTNKISFHLWFIYMILGMYLITPILKIFVNHAKERDIRYFLLLWIYASVITKFTIYFYNISFSIELFYVTNYVGYFVLGYYLATFELTSLWKKLSYAGAILGLTATFGLTYLYTANQDGAFEGFWYEYHSPNVVLISIGVFVFFKNVLKTVSKPLPFLAQQINQVSFGVYLVHILVLNILKGRLLDKIFDSIHPFISIPINVVIVLAASTCIVWVMKKIPVIEKFVP